MLRRFFVDFVSTAIGAGFFLVGAYVLGTYRHVHPEYLYAVLATVSVFALLGATESDQGEVAE